MAGCYPGGVTQDSFDRAMDPDWVARGRVASTGAMEILRESLARAHGGDGVVCANCLNGHHDGPLREDERCLCACHGISHRTTA